MSIILGKRPVLENPFDERSNSFAGSSLPFPNMKKLRINDPASDFALNAEQKRVFATNLNHLQRMFPHVKDTDLSNFLDVCDNNLQLVIELVNKSQASLSNSVQRDAQGFRNSGLMQPGGLESESELSLREETMDSQAPGTASQRTIRKILRGKATTAIAEEHKNVRSPEPEPTRHIDEQYYEAMAHKFVEFVLPSLQSCLLYTSPSPRDQA
eukprot:TRINITY_DN9153_c0_g1_i1.p1 TRINITY_DN9153_c0_g1~~TRINITY_DN9153_c0_g1_i1.p1  ORF type:complete len:239 (+),score=54.47 TRINITY_DN9153_c0_g1_i1:84-719(+)